MNTYPLQTHVVNNWVLWWKIHEYKLSDIQLYKHSTGHGNSTHSLSHITYYFLPVHEGTAELTVECHILRQDEH